jgi:hypothetical protein
MSKVQEEYYQYNKTKHNYVNKSCWICDNYIKELEKQNEHLKDSIQQMTKEVIVIRKRNAELESKFQIIEDIIYE